MHKSKKKKEFIVRKNTSFNQNIICYHCFYYCFEKDCIVNSLGNTIITITFKINDKSKDNKQKIK